jgi:myosin heavy subunit
MQNKESIIAEHNAKMKKVKIDIQDNQLNLPILLWLPKMHKNPSKQRFIAASHSCTTKSALITKCLKLIQKAHKTYCDRIKAYTGLTLCGLSIIHWKFINY